MVKPLHKWCCRWIQPFDIEANNQNKIADSYIKMTVSRLYRVNGTTAQASGVMPDILLPDILIARGQRETDNASALLVQPIEPNKYYKPNAPVNLALIKAAATNEIATSTAFLAIANRIEAIKLSKQKKDISLLLSEANKLQKGLLNMHDKEDEDETVSLKDSNAAQFLIINDAFETKRLAADSDQKEINDELKSFLLLDPYIKTVYKLLLLMK
jgi:carboxyl-terminal processing protease